ncbi:hypothetical protein OSB04_010340 [Centaurea solstitialis]|uniref:PB1 domain-containing protein n=1 Tax=Centaurea solstitialis TaxID=347529 RepID=A0AA38WP91_9ASTR|nr:hypothetical protein OSB04_010340 [Centaurea solstitialis]
MMESKNRSEFHDFLPLKVENLSGYELCNRFRLSMDTDKGADDPQLIQEKIKCAFQNLQIDDYYGGIVQFWAPTLKKDEDEDAEMIINDGAAATAFLNQTPELFLPDLEVAHQQSPPPLVSSALECGLMSCVMLPVFDHAQSRCVGVLEFSFPTFSSMCSLQVFNELNTALEEQGLKTFHARDRLPYKAISFMSTMKFDLPLLERDTRYPLWKIKMRDILIQQSLHKCILGRAFMPGAWSEEDKELNDLKAQSLIRLHLSNDVLQDVAEEETSYQIWTKLDKMFMEKSLPNKLHMKLKLYALRLSEGGSITAHLSKFKEIVGDLKNLEVKYDDEDLGLILLCSLPPSFGTFMDTIIYSRDSLSLDEVYTALSSKEKMKEINPGHEPRAEGLNARGRPFEKCSSSSSKSRSKSRGKPRKFCNFCKRKGHTMEECFKLQAKNKAKNKTTGTSGEADVVEQGEVGYCNGEVLMVSEGMMNTSEEWILDSGCTFHMCPHHSWFHKYEKVPEGVIILGFNKSKNPMWKMETKKGVAAPREGKWRSHTSSVTMDVITKDRRDSWEDDSQLILHKIRCAFLNLQIDDVFGGIVQFWAPAVSGCGRQFLTTSNQPFILGTLDLDDGKYRLCCLKYRYFVNAINNNVRVVEEDGDVGIINDGAAATAFRNQKPELLPDLNVAHQQSPSPLVSSALECGLMSCVMLPVFDPAQSRCVGVLECSTTSSMGLFELFNELNTALEKQGLKTFHARDRLQYKTIGGLEHAKNEIDDALKIIGHEYGFEFADVWIAYKDENQASLSSLEDGQAKRVIGLKLTDNDSVILDDEASKWLEHRFKTYRNTCYRLPLKMGEGLIGKTFPNYEPCLPRGKTTPIELSREQIESQFGQTQKKAAKKLNVHVSTLKRKCMKLGIKWQGKDSVEENESDTNEEEDNGGAIQDSTGEASLDKNMVTIKAEYADDVIMFTHPISSATSKAMEKEIVKRYELDPTARYKLKYYDVENKEWILFTCDENVTLFQKDKRNVRLRLLTRDPSHT